MAVGSTALGAGGIGLLLGGQVSLIWLNSLLTGSSTTTTTPAPAPPLVCPAANVALQGHSNLILYLGTVVGVLAGIGLCYLFVAGGSLLGGAGTGFLAGAGVATVLAREGSSDLILYDGTCGSEDACVGSGEQGSSDAEEDW